MYVNSHFMVTTVFLAWLYLFRNEHFYFVRNMFMVAMGIALVGYALFPTAPPRMLPGDGFTDTIATFTSVDQDTQRRQPARQQVRGGPSMHIGFSSMIAGPAVLLVRNPVGRVLWALYPLLVFCGDRRHRATTSGSTPPPARWSRSPRRWSRTGCSRRSGPATGPSGRRVPEEAGRVRCAGPGGAGSSRGRAHERRDVGRAARATPATA